MPRLTLDVAVPRLDNGGVRISMLVALVASWASSACQVGGVTTTPLSGDEPAAILLLPTQNLTGRPEPDLAVLTTGLEDAVRGRGYRVLPAGVGYDLAKKHGLPPGAIVDDAALQSVRKAAAVDAVLLLEVEDWSFERQAPQHAQWSVRWRLLSTWGQGELWSHHEQGSWTRARPAALDPTRAPDAEADVQPFGSERPRDFRSPQELARALHRAAMARLPRREG